MVNADGMNLLTGDNAYDMFKFSGYEVSTFHPYVTVETDALDQYPSAAVTINGIAEDDLETVGLDEGRNTITVTVASGGMSQTYTIVVIREEDEAPTFETQPSDLRLQVGKEVPASLGMLPMADRRKRHEELLAVGSCRRADAGLVHGRRHDDCTWSPVRLRRRVHTRRTSR